MYRLNNKQQEPKVSSAGQIKNRNPQAPNQNYQGPSYLSKYHAVQYNAIFTLLLSLIDLANYAQTPPSQIKPSPLQNYKGNLSSNKQYVGGQQKRPYQAEQLNKSMEGRAKSQENEFERSPVQKSKEKQIRNRNHNSSFYFSQKLQNPVFRSANYPSVKTESQQSAVSTSQQYKKSNQDSFQDMPLLTKESVLPYYEPTKCSTGRNGIIKAYAANTNQGIVRDYNEDLKPQTRQNENWPKCSFFGVYDGHGGAACADFLRDNLHQFVIREPEFPWNPAEALKKGFEAAETHFIELALSSYQKGVPERSGSCAIVALVVGDQCYIGNVGDSRAVMSACGGRQIASLSRDHKPCDELEQQRIQKAGGKIYQTQTHGSNEFGGQEQVMVGPLRVLPGRLSVSRTFGDIEAKLERFGGNPKVVVAEPEIKCFKIQDEHDFIVLASDGIFDKMSSNEVMNTIWEDLKSPSSSQQAQSQQLNLHALISEAVEAVLKESINRRTYDNITVVMIAFSTKQEEEPRVKTNQSVERQASVTPTIPEHQYNVPYMASIREEMEKRSFLHSKTANPVRSSYDSAHSSENSNAPHKYQIQLHQNLSYQWTYLKPKQPAKTSYTRYQNENQENVPYSQNVTQRNQQNSQAQMKQSFYPIQQQMHQHSYHLDYNNPKDLKKSVLPLQPQKTRRVPPNSAGLDDVTNRYNAKGSFIF